MTESNDFVENAVRSFFKDRGITSNLDIIVERLLQSYYEYGKSVKVATKHASLNTITLSSSELLELEEILNV